MQIRKASNQDLDQVWPIFREIAAAGDTYAYPKDISKEQALKVWFIEPREKFVFEASGRTVRRRSGCYATT
jgi:hypothetical protein